MLVIIILSSNLEIRVHDIFYAVFKPPECMSGIVFTVVSVEKSVELSADNFSDTPTDCPTDSTSDTVDGSTDIELCGRMYADGSDVHASYRVENI
jgi:hypothetical protein